ncbi:MAG: RNA polymerase sigma factor [Clostridia bacterium]|nr:RNA polymerase sigma factor [Clostridia bacterium]
MGDFEKLLRCEASVLERFVRYRIGNRHDADDVLQEIRIAAFKGYDSLKDVSLFKPWILGIARHKINDYFRAKAKSLEIPIDNLNESVLTYGAQGVTTVSVVRETLSLLGDRDKQILYLYYFKELPQAEIAKRLSLPLGTVKSRLHNAKQRFKEKYPYKPKGEIKMKQLPEIMPKYKITKVDEPPFEVRWEELMGWFIVPRLGEKISFGIYDQPGGKRGELCELEVIGKAKVHGIEGVEITAKEHEPSEANRIDNDAEAKRRFIAQLTETHCRILAESHINNGVKQFYTFLDADEFLPNWGFGENNCGVEVQLKQKGTIRMDGDTIVSEKKDFLLDIVGRYRVGINGKEYDTVCVVDFCQYEDRVISQQFLDKNGKTVLWRRFNRDDWAFSRYKKKWTEILPDNERMTVNGETFVHWYDCITDYIL